PRIVLTWHGCLSIPIPLLLSCQVRRLGSSLHQSGKFYRTGKMSTEPSLSWVYLSCISTSLRSISVLFSSIFSRAASMALSLA
ncbi:MAG: hypothetical protein Q8O37_15730, partial [Sulfuricellaceae bacterium]|nr:hypothetical protein [Sulfuricellaceae bacterium]